MSTSVGRRHHDARTAGIELRLGDGALAELRVQQRHDAGVDRVGDFQHELGIIDARYRPTSSDVPAGEVIYWAVDDVTTSYERLLALGATSYDAPPERGSGFTTASVVDPFGNILGVMFNQHYLDVLAAR